jgi:hypothetical protein
VMVAGDVLLLPSARILDEVFGDILLPEGHVDALPPAEVELAGPFVVAVRLSMVEELVTGATTTTTEELPWVLVPRIVELLLGGSTGTTGVVDTPAIVVELAPEAELTSRL